MNVKYPPSSPDRLQGKPVPDFLPGNRLLLYQRAAIGIIFQTLSEQNIKINVMQNSAISFSFCVDFRENKILKLIDHLGRNFEVYYNTGLTLVTVKNYDAALYEEYRTFRSDPGTIVRSTFQVLVKSPQGVH